MLACMSAGQGQHAKAPRLRNDTCFSWPACTSPNPRAKSQHQRVGIADMGPVLAIHHHVVVCKVWDLRWDPVQGQSQSLGGPDCSGETKLSLVVDMPVAGVASAIPDAGVHQDPAGPLCLQLSPVWCHRTRTS